MRAVRQPSYALVQPERATGTVVAGTLAGEQAVGRADVVEHGTLDDVWPLLCRADVVVGPCGGGLVSDVAAAGTPFLALPQQRPFDEQVERTWAAEVWNRAAARRRVQPCSTTQRANRSRPRGVRVALAWDTKTSGLRSGS